MEKSAEREASWFLPLYRNVIRKHERMKGIHKKSIINWTKQFWTSCIQLINVGILFLLYWNSSMRIQQNIHSIALHVSAIILSSSGAFHTKWQLQCTIIKSNNIQSKFIKIVTRSNVRTAIETRKYRSRTLLRCYEHFWSLSLLSQIHLDVQRGDRSLTVKVNMKRVLRRNHSLHRGPNLRMTGAVPPLSRVFMEYTGTAWVVRVFGQCSFDWG